MLVYILKSVTITYRIGNTHITIFNVFIVISYFGNIFPKIRNKICTSCLISSVLSSQ
jgi:hypothetical protein